jgi:hypothetical protein
MRSSGANLNVALQIKIRELKMNTLSLAGDSYGYCREILRFGMGASLSYSDE